MNQRSSAAVRKSIDQRAADYFSRRRVLVMGASGFIGQHLTARLQALGADVFAVSRRVRPDQFGAGVVTLRADASIAGDVERIFEAARPSVVVHLTSDSQGGRELELVPDSLRNDVVATVNLLQAAAIRRGTVDRFLMTGSLEEPGPDEAEPLPISPYAAAKWAACGYGRMYRALYGLDVRIVRLMMTYGPGQKPYKLIPATILSLLAGKPLTIRSGARALDWIYVDDVVDGVLAAITADRYARTVDIGSGHLTPIGDMVRTIARQLDRESLIEWGEAVRGLEMSRAADHASAREWTQFESSTPIEVGLAQTIAAFRAQLSEPGSASEGRGKSMKAQLYRGSVILPAAVEAEIRMGLAQLGEWGSQVVTTLPLV